MNFDAWPSLAPSAPSVGEPPQRPEPLQIVKRRRGSILSGIPRPATAAGGRRCWVGYGGDRGKDGGDGSSRRSSGDTEGSRGSASEPIGGDAPLRIPKRRPVAPSGPRPVQEMWQQRGDLNMTWTPSTRGGNGIGAGSGSRGVNDDDPDDEIPVTLKCKIKVQEEQESNTWESIRIRDKRRYPALRSQPPQSHVLPRNMLAQHDGTRSTSTNSLDVPLIPPRLCSPRMPPSPPPFDMGPLERGDPYFRAATCLPLGPGTVRRGAGDGSRLGGHDDIDNKNNNISINNCDYLHGEPFVLVPSVSVTPDCKRIDTDSASRHGSLGTSRTSFWAAVQVGTQLCRPEVASCRPEVASGRFGGMWYANGAQVQVPREIQDDELGLYRYGYLYDVVLELQPTVCSSVLEILLDKSAPTVLNPGGKILALAHVELDTSSNTTSKSVTTATGECDGTVETSPSSSPGRSSSRHGRQNSDELMRDLELQLAGCATGGGSGATTQTEYLRVRLTYRHSGMLPRSGPGAAVGMANEGGGGGPTTAAVSHRVEAEFAATIPTRTRSANSPWSPAPPPLAKATTDPGNNPVLQIVAFSWGVKTAREVMGRMAAAAVSSSSSSSSLSSSHTTHRQQQPQPQRAKTPCHSPTPAPYRSPLTPRRPVPPIPPTRRASLQQKGGSGRTSGGAEAAAPFEDCGGCVASPPSARGRHQQRQSGVTMAAGAATTSATTTTDNTSAGAATPDPAHRIWSEIRRESGSFRPAALDTLTSTAAVAAATMGGRPTRGLVASRVEGLQAQQQKQQQQKQQQQHKDVRVPGSATPTPTRAKTQRHREAVIRDAAVRNRRSVGADTLRGLVPSEFGTVGLGENLGRGASGSRGSSGDYCGRGGSLALQGEGEMRGLRGAGAKAKRESGRWNWSGWW